MKKSIVLMAIASFMFVACGETKKEEVKKEVDAKVETVKEPTKADASIELGKKLFAEKTCTTCHQVSTKVIGPSILDINKVYAEKNGDMLKFLKSEAEAIVDTDPGQVAIMKANLDGFVKALSDEELNALVAYIKSVK